MHVRYWPYWSYSSSRLPRRVRRNRIAYEIVAPATPLRVRPDGRRFSIFRERQ